MGSFQEGIQKLNSNYRNNSECFLEIWNKFKMDTAFQIYF